MSREKNPKREQAYEIFRKSKGTLQSKDIARIVGVTDSLIRKWKSLDNWDSFNNTANNIREINVKDNDSQSSNTNDLNSNISEINASLVQNLIKQIEEKDKQINMKDSQLKDSFRLIENMQVLLKTAQENNMLSAHNGMVEKKETPKEEVSIAEEKRSFLGKLFKRR